jgi:hypothetical protein
MLKNVALAVGFLGCTVLGFGSADAASRTPCLCKGKETGRYHHRFACEYHFKKPGKWPAGAAPSQPEAACAPEEWAQFKTYLCVESRCTYEYVKFSPAKVPLGAK